MALRTTSVCSAACGASTEETEAMETQSDLEGWLREGQSKPSRLASPVSNAKLCERLFLTQRHRGTKAQSAEQAIWVHAESQRAQRLAAAVFDRIYRIIRICGGLGSLSILSILLILSKNSANSAALHEPKPPRLSLCLRASVSLC